MYGVVKNSDTTSICFDVSYDAFVKFFCADNTLDERKLGRDSFFGAVTRKEVASRNNTDTFTNEAHCFSNCCFAATQLYFIHKCILHLFCLKQKKSRGDGSFLKNDDLLGLDP